VGPQHPQHLEFRHEQDGKEYARSAPTFLSVPSASTFNESFHTTIGFNQNESQDLNSYPFPEFAHFIGSDGEVDVARLIQSRRDLLPLLKAKASGKWRHNKDQIDVIIEPRRFFFMLHSDLFQAIRPKQSGS
jgi:hypothetical protein